MSYIYILVTQKSTDFWPTIYSDILMCIIYIIYYYLYNIIYYIILFYSNKSTKIINNDFNSVTFLSIF